jgi:hypothetical protein
VKDDFWRIWKQLGFIFPDELRTTDEKNGSAELVREMHQRGRRYNYTFCLNIVSEMLELMCMRVVDVLHLFELNVYLSALNL